jgi:hypothetical protein
MKLTIISITIEKKPKKKIITKLYHSVKSFQSIINEHTSFNLPYDKRTLETKFMTLR